MQQNSDKLGRINNAVVFSDRLQPLFKLVFLQPGVRKRTFSHCAVCFALWFRYLCRASPQPEPITWIEHAVVNIGRKINIMLFWSQSLWTTLEQKLRLLNTF